jgi:hypothetical protein
LSPFDFRVAGVEGCVAVSKFFGLAVEEAGLLEERFMASCISSSLKSQFFPFFILSGKGGRSIRMTMPEKMPMIPSIMKSQRQGALPVSATVRFFPMP